MENSFDSILQQPVVGVYPINIHNIHQATDGGGCTFQKQFIKQFYNANSGYYVPGGYFLSFTSFTGSHQLWLDNFEFKKGLVYTLSYYLKTNSKRNPWKNGVGTIQSEKAGFNIQCKAFVPGMLNVTNTVLNLSVNDHSPQLKKYTSLPFQPQKDTPVSIIIHPNPWERNGYLWDLFYPEIQWRHKM